MAHHDDIDAVATFVRERLNEQPRRDTTGRRLIVDEWEREDRLGGAPAGLAFAVRALATDWLDHPDYRAAWNPHSR